MPARSTRICGCPIRHSRRDDKSAKPVSDWDVQPRFTGRAREAAPHFTPQDEFQGMDKRFPLEDQIEMLGSALRGRLITPGQAGYDTLRLGAITNADSHPAAIVRVA